VENEGNEPVPTIYKKKKKEKRGGSEPTNRREKKEGRRVHLFYHLSGSWCSPTLKKGKIRGTLSREKGKDRIRDDIRAQDPSLIFLLGKEKKESWEREP